MVQIEGCEDKSELSVLDDDDDDDDDDDNDGDDVDDDDAGGKWCKLKAVEINLNPLFLPRSALLSPLGEARSKWGVSQDQEETLGRKATWDISEPRKCRRNISEL